MTGATARARRGGERAVRENTDVSALSNGRGERYRLTEPMKGCPVTPTGADSGDAERCLHEVWAELTARGFVVDEPGGGTCQCFYENLGGAYCEMDLLVTGEMVWVYEPRQPDFSPWQTARLVLALLTGTSRPAPDMPPAPGPELAPKDAAGRMLADCGMAAKSADIHYGPGEVSAQVMVTNPASPHRGHARISDETVQWECWLAAPGNPSFGLVPLDVAAAIAAALAGTSGEASDDVV